MVTLADLKEALKLFIYGSQGVQLQQKAGTHELLVEDTGINIKEALREELQVLKRLYPTGKMVFFDDFNEPELKWGWFYGLGGSGEGAIRDTRYPFMGHASMRCNVSGPTMAAYIEPIKFLGYFPEEKMGIELWFALKDDKLNHIKFGIEYGDGTNYYVQQIQYDIPNLWWEVSHAGGDTTIVNTDLVTYCGVKAGTLVWHHAKAVVDFKTKKHMYAILDGVKYDLSNYSLIQVASPTLFKNATLAYTYVESKDGSDAWFDQIAVTIGEK